MSCNCNPISPCGNCARGVPCNCPPVYPIPHSTVPCNCCPNGYTYQSPSSLYPNGLCISNSPTTIKTWCCNPGYTYNPSVPNFLNGACTNNGGATYIDPIQCPGIAPIPCVPCETISTTDCIQYSGIIPLTCNPSGINPNDTLTTILDKLCFTNPVNIMAFINAIANNQTLYDGFCNLVAGCGVTPGVTTPIIGPISWTIP